jgi:ankyrin repeat protein
MPPKLNAFMQIFETLQDPHTQETRIAKATEQIRDLIKSGVDVNVADKQRNRPIHAAAKFVMADIVQALLAAGADVKAVNDSGQTACHAVAASWSESADKSRIVTMLIDAGCDVNALDQQYRTPLHLAARNGDVDLLKLFVAAGASLRGERSTPLHDAAMRYKADAVKFLLGAGADVNARDSILRTPLHVATNAECVNILIDAGADLDAVDAEGRTACACAAFSNTESALSAHVVAGANVDAVDAKGNSLCHLAALVGGVDSLKWLLSAGANVNAVNHKGETPLHCATDNNKYVIASLVAAGIDLAAVDTNGRTALQVAQRLKNPAVVPFLTDVYNSTDITQSKWYEIRQADFAAARLELARLQVVRIRRRVVQICVALHSARLPASVLVTVIDAACVASLIPAHQKLELANKVLLLHVHHPPM